MASRRRGSGLPSEELDIKRCLSFVNTRTGRATADPTETLVSFDTLVAWARETGLLAQEDAARLAARAKRRQAEAERVLTEARELRELLHEVFAARADRRTPSAATLEELSARLGGWYRYARLVPGEDALQWVYAGDDGFDRVVWEVARTATRLLTSSRLARLRPCAANDCGWWFLDDTKNGSRRWCDMTICGNRAKARRFRRRSLSR